MRPVPNREPRITRTIGDSRPASIEYLTIRKPATASVTPPAQIGSLRPNRSSKLMVRFLGFSNSGSGSSGGASSIRAVSTASSTMGSRETMTAGARTVSGSLHGPLRSGCNSATGGRSDSSSFFSLERKLATSRHNAAHTRINTTVRIPTNAPRSPLYPKISGIGQARPLFTRAGRVISPPGCVHARKFTLLGRRQVVRHRLLMPAFAGSNPAAPANATPSGSPA